MSWSPSVLVRVLASVPSSTRPFPVETEQGNAFLKVRGNPEGPHTLASEWVAVRLARLLGLCVRLTFASFLWGRAVLFAWKSRPKKAKEAHLRPKRNAENRGAEMKANLGTWQTEPISRG